MKMIEAVVRRGRVSDVLSALAELELGADVAVSEVVGHGVQRGVHEQWRGEPYTADLLPKTLLMLVVEDDDLTEAIETIVASAKTGRLGDGKVFVGPVDDAVRVRTREHGHDALRSPASDPHLENSAETTISPDVARRETAR